MAGTRSLILPLLVILLCFCLEHSAAKKKKPCKYNKEKYKAGEVIAALEENCAELKCSKKGKNVELTPMEDCTCGGTVTDGPEPPKPTDGGGSGGTGSGECDCDYKSKYPDSHTMNKYDGPDAAACGERTDKHKIGVTDDDIKTILKFHNELRELVAKGEETKGDPGPQPGATNMFELKWNCELAEVAQRWAEQCKLGHDKSDDRKICSEDYSYNGQNAFMEWHYSDASAWETSVNNWYGEVKDMPKSLVDGFASPSSGKVIGHYTQVVWAETFEIGCGAIHFPAKLGSNTYEQSKVYVCNYGPGGNWLGSKIYKTGSAATDCPNGVSADYPGLCAPPS